MVAGDFGNDKMYEFVDRLINISIPRIRDFRVVPIRVLREKLHFGCQRTVGFFKINYDKVDKIRGLGITFVTTAENDVQAKALLDLFIFLLK